MKEFTVTFKVAGPDELTARQVAGIFDDAMAEELDRNNEDPTHPDVEISDAKVRETAVNEYQYGVCAHCGQQVARKDGHWQACSGHRHLYCRESPSTWHEVES